MGSDWSTRNWNKLGSDFFSSPRAFRQFRSKDFRRAGKNNRLAESQSLQNAEQPFNHADTAQFC
jgi:hypothetical protein